MKLYLKELACYKDVPTEEQNYQNFYYPDKYFDLGELPTEGLQNEFGCFIYDRCNNRTVKSTYIDLRLYIHTSSFLSMYYPQLESLQSVQKEECINNMKKYLLSNNIPILQKNGYDSPSIAHTCEKH